MSPTKLLVEAVAIVLLAAPMALAEETAAAPPEEVAKQTSSGLEPGAVASPDEPDALDLAGPAEVASQQEVALDAPPAKQDESGAIADEPANSDASASDAQDLEVSAESDLEIEGLEPEPESDSVPAGWSPAAEGASATPSDAEELSATETESESDAEPVADDLGTTLGAIGYDSEGRRGRVHIVVPHDTLWDISNAYLGTPWVWPSIWSDNDDIENPHLIHPGDHIWITPSEMRRVTPEEAALLLANRPMEDAPAALDEADATGPEESAPELLAEPVDRGSYRVSAREMVGLITPEQFEASASIVDSVPERVLMSQEDSVYVGLGEADLEVGDELTIFRTNQKVFDPDTGALLGYHVEILGWLQVLETYPETSLAKIGMSTAEIEVTDRVMPREPLPAEIAIQASPQDVEGKISFFPNKRVLMGFNDFVYLNRGTLDGLEAGSPLVVYRPGRMAKEPTRGESVHVPDAVVAQMLVVRTEAQSSVALVTHSSTELELGDRFRGAR